MHKVEALERVVDVDTTEEMHTALFAGVALDSRRLVDDSKFIAVGCDGDFVFWDDANDGEEGAFRFPAFRAATGVIKGHVAIERYFDLSRGAVAVQLAAGEGGAALGETVVDCGVDRRHSGSCEWSCTIGWMVGLL